MGRFKDITGKRYGRLTVVRRAGSDKTKKATWLCRCDCGKEIVVPTGHLNSGHTMSCGCLYIEIRKVAHITHGDTIGGNRLRTAEYRTWYHMRDRCTNPADPDYSLYGERGIRVCEEWLKSYEAFLQYVGRKPSPKHSLDRIDPHGNYEPGNVRWATAKEQARNWGRRNRLIMYNGRTQCMSAWAEELGTTSQDIYNRLRRGQSVEDAFGRIISLRARQFRADCWRDSAAPGCGRQHGG